MEKQKALDKLIVRQKKLIAGLAHHGDKNMIGIAEKIAKECSLVVANFKCQKCESETELQYHHLIMRRAKDFMDFFRYATQRYYWANIIILCRKCHGDYHSMMKIKDDDIDGIISKEVLDKLKIKWSEK